MAIVYYSDSIEQAVDFSFDSVLFVRKPSNCGTIAAITFTLFYSLNEEQRFKPPSSILNSLSCLSKPSGNKGVREPQFSILN
jgi:hypothetical protein